MLELLQTMIVIILFFTIAFGLGFILNMLIKTTWLPLYLYLFVIVGLVLYAAIREGHVLENLGEYQIVDYLTGLGGAFGAVLSGITIRTLRKRGYQMF